MTTKEQEQFLKEYHELLDCKNDIQTHGYHLQNLHRWDKNGSHNKAILKALDKKKVLNDKLTLLLKGKNWDQWRYVRVKLSSLTARLKTTTIRKEKIEQEIHQLTL